MSAQAVPAQTEPQRWASVGAATRFGATCFNSDPYTTSGYFAAELSADALAYTYDPDPARGLALVAYGGLGPRFLVQPAFIYYSPGAPFATAYQLNVGGVGGLEARLQNFGVFLELDVSLPAVGLIGPYFRVFPTEAFPLPKLTLGASYFF